MEDKDQRRQKMNEDLTSFFKGVRAEIGHFVDKASKHVDKVVDGARELHADLNADPEVQNAKRRAKETLGRLGKHLVNKFGTQAEKDAINKAKRKRAPKKPAPDAQAPPPETGS
jgi:hypothetical protein